MVKGNYKRSSFGPFHALALLIVVFILDYARQLSGSTGKFDLQAYLDSPSFNMEAASLETEAALENVSPVDDATPTQGVILAPDLAKNVIGYAISMTKCQPGGERLDQAAILLYSIHRNSLRATSATKYDYKAYAFVHPEASNCTQQLQEFGYEVHIKESPVLKEDITGRLKEFIHEASCCQEKEFLKLYSYTLTKHSVVVHLDLDCLILKPMDDLFDSMIEGPESEARGRLARQWNDQPLPTNIEAFFTRDYNLVNPGVRQPHQIGIQGGFLVVKPNMELFEEYRTIIIDGNYTRSLGWGGKLKYGGYYGAAQIQGLCAYVFGAIRPGTAVELNRCYYNFMGDNPRDPNSDNRCRTLEDECQDCRQVSFDELKTIHFTLCAKPWWCLAHERNAERKNHLGGPEAFDLCIAAHHQWFTTRFMLEQEWSKKDPDYKMSSNVNISDSTTAGFCQSGGTYLPMQFPKKRIEL